MFVGVLLGKKKPCRTCMGKETNDWANRSWKERKDFEPGVRTPAGLCSALGLGLPLLGCREIGPSWVTLGLNWVLDLGPSTYNKYKENTKNKNKHSSLDKIRRLQHSKILYSCY